MVPRELERAGQGEGEREELEHRYIGGTGCVMTETIHVFSPSPSCSVMTATPPSGLRGPSPADVLAESLIEYMVCGESMSRSCDVAPPASVMLEEGGE